MSFTNNISIGMKVHWIGGEAEVDRSFRLFICTSSCRWIITIITNYEVMRTWERKVKKSYINCYVTGLNWLLCYIIVFHRCVPIPYIALSTWKRINWISENLDNSLDMPSRKGKKTIKFGHCLPCTSTRGGHRLHDVLRFEEHRQKHWRRWSF